jgi:hypothetical protein
MPRWTSSRFAVEWQESAAVLIVTIDGGYDSGPSQTKATVHLHEPSTAAHFIELEGA